MSIRTVIGAVAPGVADNGDEPVKIGGKAQNGSPGAVSNGQRVEQWFTLHGATVVAGAQGVGQDGTANAALAAMVYPGAASGTSNLLTAPSLFNGTTWDRQRGNQDSITLLASGTYNSTQTGTDQTNYNARGVIVVLDATAVAGVGSFTLSIQGKDPVSGKYYTLLAGAAVTTVTTNVYTVYPGAPATANVSANSPLPRTWRVVSTYNSGTSLTFSVGASLII